MASIHSPFTFHTLEYIVDIRAVIFTTPILICHLILLKYHDKIFRPQLIANPSHMQSHFFNLMKDNIRKDGEPLNQFLNKFRILIHPLVFLLICDKTSF